MKDSKLKLKVNQKVLLDREQLRNVIGGQSGSGDCLLYGDKCDSMSGMHCCPGLVCAEFRCYLET